MVIHTETCRTCGCEFAFDAPVHPAVTPDYCRATCARQTTKTND